MRVGVYVDGFNLYYGARNICGKSTQGWRWLDLKSLVHSIIKKKSTWISPEIVNITFCTARISGATKDEARQEQDVYLRALSHTKSATQITYGNYVSRIATAPLARR